MIGITIKTHTTKAIANEVVAGGSACPPPRPRDLSSVVVVRDEATPLCFNVPGLTGGERAPCYLWARAQVLWCQQGRVAAQRLGGGAEIGLAAHPWVGVSVVPRFVERPLAKGLVPARMDRLQGAHMVAEKGRGCRMGCCSIREKKVVTTASRLRVRATRCPRGSPLTCRASLADRDPRIRSRCSVRAHSRSSRLHSRLVHRTQAGAHTWSWGERSKPPEPRRRPNSW